MTVTESTKEVIARVNAAAIASGRDPKDVRLIAASKMNDAGRVREAIAAGIEICGENRVQEMLEKNAQGAYDNCELHFIGHLQKNKAKQVVGLAKLIHSVDSVELLEVIDKCAGKKGIVQDVLLEINIGAEESKSGFEPEEIAHALEKASTFSNIHVRGLMAIPPKCENGEDNRIYFSQIRKLFIDNCDKKYDNVDMDFMSMGMSGDFETAIACGSNMVRVGSAIFGERIYPEKR